MNDLTLIILAAGSARRYGGVKQLAPVGPKGEAVIDLVAGDAYASGFTHVTLVINPDSGPQIREHVAAHWPNAHGVSFAVQDRPLGTVHAVLSASTVLDESGAFAVANADDLYGRDAMGALARFLRTNAQNCLAGYRLDRALVGQQSVTRGVCKVHEGVLESIVERRHVHKSEDGFVSDDGLQPRSLRADTRVSMNLWGFEPKMWSTFRDAMERAEDPSEKSEVLLPDVIGRSVRDGAVSFRVLEVNSACIGVTHADDLELVQSSVREQIERRERPAGAFEA